VAVAVTEAVTVSAKGSVFLPSSGHRHLLQSGIASVHLRALLDARAETPVSDGMSPRGRELRGRHEGEGAFEESRVRQLEMRAATHEVLAEEQIEVEEARTPALLLHPVTTGLGFETMTRCEQRSRWARPVDECGRVEIIGLGRADGSTAIEARHRDDGRALGEALEGAVEGRGRVAEVASEADQNLHLNARCITAR
jgi:hypothetical protein